MTCVTRGCHSCHCLINFSLVAVAAMVLQHTPFAYAMAIMASIPNPQSEPLGNAEEVVASRSILKALVMMARKFL